MISAEATEIVRGGLHAHLGVRIALIPGVDGFLQARDLVGRVELTKDELHLLATRHRRSTGRARDGCGRAAGCQQRDRADSQAAAKNLATRDRPIACGILKTNYLEEFMPLTRSGSARPNVILMIADDHRYDAIGAYGDPTVQTPVLDDLVRGGVSFDRTYILGGQTAAVCAPARASLMTGHNPIRAAVTTDVVPPRGVLPIRPDLPLLPEVFRQVGYFTFHVGKWHNDPASLVRAFRAGDHVFLGGMSDHRRVPVFDFDPSGIFPEAARFIAEGFSTEIFSDAAISFLSSYDDEQPFFLYVAYTAPHDPRTPPPEFAALYDPEHIPLPANVLPEHPFDNGELRVRDELLAPFPRTAEVIRQHIADYFGMISHLDAQIGRVLDVLAETGHGENTIVVYTADHGLAVGQHGLMGKQNTYEHSVHVPAIVRGPGLPAGRRVSGLTHTYDLYPTLCELAGVPVPETLESRSLLPLLSGASQIRNSVHAMYKDVQRMASDGHWKLIEYSRAAERGVGSDRAQLFDLASDPLELSDRSGDAACHGELERLREDLRAWQQQIGDPMLERGAC